MKNGLARRINDFLVIRTTSCQGGLEQTTDHTQIEVVCVLSRKTRGNPLVVLQGQAHSLHSCLPLLIQEGEEEQGSQFVFLGII